MNVRARCETCAVRLRAICGAIPEAAAAALSQASHMRRIPAGQTIYSELYDPGWFAIVVFGVIKLVKTRGDGRQQIVGLLFESDFLGRLFDRHTDLTAEATTNLELCCFSRGVFESLMQEHKSLEHALLRRTLDNLDSSRDWIFLLGRRTAQERVASLLLFIAERIARGRNEVIAGTSEFELNMPLSRADMADFLGLTIETISRELHGLKLAGLIATKGRRRITLCELAALRRLADGV